MITNQKQQEQFSIQSKNKGKYSKTTMKKKTQLIDLVINQDFSIYKASKKLRMSNSTSKSIISNYLKYGTILERNTKHRIQKLKTTLNIKEQQNQDQSFEQVSELSKLMVKQEEQHDKIAEPIKKQEAEQVQPTFIPNYPFIAFGFTVPFLCDK